MLYLDVNLAQVSEEALVGSWHVETRVLAHADPATGLALARQLTLKPGQELCLTPAAGTGTGTWRIERDPLLKRPYLLLTLPATAGSSATSTRALITRLRQAKVGAARQLTLYFQTGMELQLAWAPDHPLGAA